MDTKQLIHADLLDILFEGKNKDYGAYELRKNYNSRITTALISMAIICLLFFLSSLLANKRSGHTDPIQLTELHLQTLDKPTPLEVLPTIKPPKVTTPRAAVIQFTTPVITDHVAPDEQAPVMDEIDQNQIGLINRDGLKNAEITAPPVESSIGAVESLKKPVIDYEKPFTKVEKEARFPGGLEGWKRYLERNLNSNVAADNGAPIGNYTVKVQFIVDRTGVLSDVRAIDIPAACPDCGREAVKVIEHGPKWEPAVQNGQYVNYQAIQYVTFQVLEQ